MTRWPTCSTTVRSACAALFSKSGSNYTATVPDGRFAQFDLMGNLVTSNSTTAILGEIPRYWYSTTLSASALASVISSMTTGPVTDTQAPGVSIDRTPWAQAPSKLLPFQFRWTAIDTLNQNTDDNPDLVQTRWRLTDQTAWSDWTAYRTATLSSYPIGGTELQVQARDPAGNISESDGPLFYFTPPGTGVSLITIGNLFSRP